MWAPQIYFSKHACSQVLRLSVSAYSIQEHSVIVLIGSSAPLSKQRAQPSASANKSEQSTITQIHSEMDNVRTTLLPDVDTFLMSLLPSRSESTPSHQKLEAEHNRLAELLLQALLRLDAITPDGTWQEARAERKGAVKEVQALLDRLDEGWSRSE
jgi:hypothetical protein